MIIKLINKASVIWYKVIFHYLVYYFLPEIRSYIFAEKTIIFIFMRITEQSTKHNEVECMNFMVH